MSACPSTNRIRTRILADLSADLSDTRDFPREDVRQGWARVHVDTCTVLDKLYCTRLQNYTTDASLMSVSVSVPWNSSLTPARDKYEFVPVRWRLVRRWNKCVKQLPLVVQVRLHSRIAQTPSVRFVVDLLDASPNRLTASLCCFPTAFAYSANLSLFDTITKHYFAGLYRCVIEQTEDCWPFCVSNSRLKTFRSGFSTAN